MKLAILGLFIGGSLMGGPLAGQAFGATRIIDVAVPATQQIPSGSTLTVCTYDASLNFSSFPDFDVFSQVPKTNTWDKSGKNVQATVEIQDDHTYVLHLSLMPEFPDAGQSCDTKNVKVLVRE